MANHYLLKPVVIDKLCEQCDSHRVISVDITVSTDIEEGVYKPLNRGIKEVSEISQV